MWSQGPHKAHNKCMRDTFLIFDVGSHCKSPSPRKNSCLRTLIYPDPRSTAGLQWILWPFSLNFNSILFSFDLNPTDQFQSKEKEMDIYGLKNRHLLWTRKKKKQIQYSLEGACTTNSKSLLFVVLLFAVLTIYIKFMRNLTLYSCIKPRLAIRGCAIPIQIFL